MGVRLAEGDEDPRAPAAGMGPPARNPLLSCPRASPCAAQTPLRPTLTRLYHPVPQTFSSEG